MDVRQERGVQLAQRGYIVQHANGWKVRSQSGNGSYFVHLDDRPSCTCPDQEYAHAEKSGQTAASADAGRGVESNGKDAAVPSV